jgi:hypothetical protein
MQNNISCIEMTRGAEHVARMEKRRSAYRVFSWGRLREINKLENLAHY